jgi:hypothetical protein
MTIETPMPAMERALQFLVDSATAVVEAVGEPLAARAMQSWDEVLATGELTDDDESDE